MRLHVLSLAALSLLATSSRSADRSGQVADRGPPRQEQALGSLVPCAVPLDWTIGDVDPRFELTAARALAAARRAASIWEEAVGADLFTFEGPSAFPISFEFDDRQARSGVRRRRRDDLDTVAERLERRKEELEAASERFESASARYRREADAYERRMAAYNAEVARWNERGGAPPEARAALDETREALSRERASLSNAESELRALGDRIDGEVDAANEQIREHARDEERFAADFPLVATESGRYVESVRWQDDRIESVSRAIRIFRFDDPDDLVLVLAHELGHALGLGHAAARGAVMSEVLDVQYGEEKPPSITPVDVEMLARRCPAL